MGQAWVVDIVVKGRVVAVVVERVVAMRRLDTPMIGRGRRNGLLVICMGGMQVFLLCFSLFVLSDRSHACYM